MQDHISDIEARLRVLNLIVDPLLVILNDVVGHEFGQLLLSVHVAALFLTFLERGWHDLLTHLILSLGRCVWQWSVIGSSVHLHPLDNLVTCLLKDLSRLGLCLDFLDDASVFTPRHRLASVLIGT